MRRRGNHRLIRAAPTPSLCVAGIALTLVACEPGKAKIKGSTARVVGDRVTLELTEGDEPFAAVVELETSDGTTYDSQKLRLRRLDAGKKLELIIPAGVAIGPARLRVNKEDAGGTYEVPLTIDRLAVFLTDKGEIHLVPLPPAKLEARSFKVGEAQVFFSTSDDGTTLATATSDKLSLLRLTGRADERSVSVKLPGPVQALAALPDGAIVALTDKSVDPPRGVLQRYERDAQGELTKSDSRLLKTSAIRAVAAVDRSPRGPIAGVLAECGSGGDCVAQIDFHAPANGSEIELHELDSTSSAKAIALSTDGLLLAVPDTDAIYGVAFSASGKPSDSRPLSWSHDGAVVPVGIARTRTLVGRSGDAAAAEDVFAAAEGTARTLRLFGAPAGDLRELQQQPPPTDTAPLAIAFGRDRDIYLLSERRQVQTITAGETSTAGAGSANGGFRSVDIAVPQGAIDLLVQR